MHNGVDCTRRDFVKMTTGTALATAAATQTLDLRLPAMLP